MVVIHLADIFHHDRTLVDEIIFMKTTFRGKQMMMCLGVLILLTILRIHVAIPETDIWFLFF